MSAEQAIDHKCPDQVGVTRGEALADQLRCNLGPYDKSVEVKPRVVGGDGADPDGDGGQVRRRRRDPGRACSQRASSPLVTPIAEACLSVCRPKLIRRPKKVGSKKRGMYAKRTKKTTSLMRLIG